MGEKGCMYRDLTDEAGRVLAVQVVSSALHSMSVI